MEWNFHHWKWCQVFENTTYQQWFEIIVTLIFKCTISIRCQEIHKVTHIPLLFTCYKFSRQKLASTAHLRNSECSPSKLRMLAGHCMSYIHAQISIYTPGMLWPSHAGMCNTSVMTLRVRSGFFLNVSKTTNILSILTPGDLLYVCLLV